MSEPKQDLKQLLKKLQCVKNQTNSSFGKSHSDEKKVVAIGLVSKGYTLQQVADLLGVRSKSTIHEWVHQNAEEGGILDEYGMQDISEHIKKTLASRQTQIASNILESVTQEDIKKASLLQKTTAHCQLVDKARLLQGESTENISMIVNKGHKVTEKLSDTAQAIKDLEDELK